MTDARPPGWYDEPSGDRTRLRWWDGTAWTGIVRDRAPYEPAPVLSAVPSGAASALGTSGPSGPSGQAAGATRVGPVEVLDARDSFQLGSRGGWALGLLVVLLVGVLALTFLPGVGGRTPRTVSAGSSTSGLPNQGFPKLGTPTRPTPPTRTAPPRPVSGRVTDAEAGLSYQVLPGDWQAWDGVQFEGFLTLTGYYRVVQQNAPGGAYWANVTSGLVLPDPTNNLQATAEDMSAQLSSLYYPKHTRRDEVARATTVDGHQAYLIQYVAAFDPSAAAGYQAKSEQITVLLVDTGRGLPAALYASLPDTVQSLWPAVNDLVASVKVLAR